MKFAEDLSLSEEIECGEIHFDRETMIRFAREFDPQPFHLTDSAVQGTFFSSLSASGLHVAAASLSCALNGPFRAMSYLGSPGASELRMYQPVYAGTTLRVFQKFTSVDLPDEWPGVAFVTGERRAVAEDGSLVMACADTSWFAARRCDTSIDLGRLSNWGGAMPGLSAMQPIQVAKREPQLPEPGRRLWFEDFSIGRTFLSDWFGVRETALQWFHAKFDGRTANTCPGSRLCQDLTNRWTSPGVVARQLVETLWDLSEMAGGGSLLGLRWSSEVRAGDALRLQATIVEARPLKSRKDVGLVSISVACMNQREETIGQLQVMAFIRKDATARVAV